MNDDRDQRPAVTPKVAKALAVLSPDEREALLIKCWMSHDSRWFAAVAMTCGMEAANRANKLAVHEEGKVEARRLARALNLPPVRSVDDFILVQEVMISFLGPDLLDFEVVTAGDEGFAYRVRRCFAFDNVTKAGVASQYECGIFPRMTGWLEAMGVQFEMSPPLGNCLKAAGRECAYAFRLTGYPASDR
jgi:hypothetical protein